MTREDYWLATALCQPKTGRIAMSYVTGERSSVAMLHELYQQLPRSLRMRVGDKRMACAMLALALVDMRTPKRCKTCQGRGEVPDDRSIVRECDACFGRGTLQRPEHERAQLAGVSLNAWRQFWAPIFYEVEQHLKDSLNQAQHHVKQLLA